MNNKKRLVVAGSCPLCGGRLHYSNTENNGNTISYFWKCVDCNETGLEVYKLTFIEHYVDSIDGYFSEGAEIENKGEYENE